MHGLVVLLVLAAFSPVSASAARRVPVDTSWSSATSDSVGQFEYDADTGELFMKDRAVTAFGKIPGLQPTDVEILASDFLGEAKPGETTAVVIRHGNWVSIIDPINDKALAVNLGPVERAQRGEAYAKVLKLEDGSFVATFAGHARVLHGDNAGPRDLIYVYNSKNETLGWFPVRTDKEPSTMKVSLFAPGFVKFTGQYQIPVVTKKADGKTSTSSIPVDGEMIVDLKKGEITQQPGANFTETGKTEKATTRKLDGMYEAEAAHEFIGVQASAQQLMASGNRADPKARAAAIAIARTQIDAARGIEKDIRDAMKDLYGQDEAVDALVKIAQNQADAAGHTVVMLGGATGVGKTSGFHSFIKGFLKAQGIQSEQPYLDISLNDVTDDKHLDGMLFGPKPPWMGADAPSNLVLWLLNNPNGGGILFDEAEKPPAAVFEKLMSFFEKGEVTLTPFLVGKLCEYFKSTPKEQWPALLRTATEDGDRPQTEIVIKLTKNHIIGLGTNAGNSTYGDNGTGKELTSEQDIAQANRRFTGDLIKQELKAKGIKGEVLNRINAFIPFKKLLMKDHVRIADQQIAEVERLFATKLIDVRFSDAARKFFESETYDPSSGARNVKDRINAWITQNLNNAVISRALVNPGDEIVIDVAAGNGSSVASIMRVQRNGESSPLVEYTVGKPLPPSPEALLNRARERLQATLERRIVGHRAEIDLLTKAIIKKLALATADPAAKGRPIVIYFDGTPGIGKTEIAKAVAEALFDDASRLTRVDFNEIVDMGTLYKFGIEKMNAAIKTSPDSQVMLWDELHRLSHTPAHQLIENTLMNVIDEGKLPKSPDSADKIDMPGATVIIATGNLLEQALRPGARSMTNRELQAEFRLLMRHPEQFLAVFEKSFGGAFRSRLGAPLIFSPLTDEEVAILRDRIFETNTKILRDNGVKPVLSQSAKDFFLREYVPMEGGRWIRRAMELYVENALVATIAGTGDKYKGTEMEIVFDASDRKLKAIVKKDAAPVETLTLADVPRGKSEYSPVARERAAWKTSVHEAGHALVRAVLYGPDSVAEINTFGGGEGGWMERNTAVDTEDMYYTTKSGIKEIAVALAGHLAELKYLGQSANGASSDFNNARRVAQTMLIDGSMPDISPISLIVNPSTGQIDMSDGKKVELEKKTDFIMEYAGRIAQAILDQNSAVHMTVAHALHDNADMHMEGTAFAGLVRGKLVELDAKQMESARVEAVAAVERKAHLSCEALLTQAGAVATPNPVR